MSFYSHAQIPRYKGQGKKKTSGQKSGAKVTCMRAEGRAARGADRGRAGRLRALSSYYLGPCGADRGRAGRLWALSSRCGGEVFFRGHFLLSVAEHDKVTVA